MAQSESTSLRCWYVMRDLRRANAKLPAYKQMEEEGFEVFTPMGELLRVRGGRRIREKVPVIRDLFFVHDTRKAIDRIVEKNHTIQYRYKRGGYRIPMTVAEADMERFTHAVGGTDSPKYFMPGELTPEMCGRTVRIVGGPLTGYAGMLLSLCGSKKRHLIVELPNFLSAGVEVSPEYIEFI